MESIKEEEIKAILKELGSDVEDYKDIILMLAKWGLKLMPELPYQLLKFQLDIIKSKKEQGII